LLSGSSKPSPANSTPKQSGTEINHPGDSLQKRLLSEKKYQSGDPSPHSKNPGGTLTCWSEAGFLE
jgi:hypothetical protein